MEEHNPHYSSETRAKWSKVLVEILKYALGAVLGGLGITLGGCASVPMLVF